MKKRKKYNLLSIIIIILISVITYLKNDIVDIINEEKFNKSLIIYKVEEYNEKDYIVLNNNEPNFLDSEKTYDSFEIYNKLDKLNRATGAFANISIDTMPKEERGSIGQIKPTGWHTIKYDNIDGKYLYNRCHLIGYQLTGENANERNLITCTRNMNVNTMLEFENKVANYIKETNNHVLYRVAVIYEDNNLLASGIQMEALSIEDNGEGIKFNVFIYNVQEGIKIDYKTGESELDE